jgi:hypothetical protein
VAKKILSVDRELAEHLKQAEQHLIGAVTLFTENDKLNRNTGYFSRLVRAQELATGLYREELVRLRGPHHLKRRK